MVRSPLIISILVVISVGCTKNDTHIEYRNPEVYVFLGHTYFSRTLIDKRIQPLNLANHHYLLGGDICSNTEDQISLFRCLDFLLDIKSPNTHWAFGNHDININAIPITSFTQQSEYYATYIDGLTLMVLNTNLALSGSTCEENEKQTQYFLNVLDTISSSSHLIILSHHVFWGDMNDDETPVMQYANTNHSNRHVNCEVGVSAKDVFEEQLLKIQSNGTQVIFLAGDLGQKQSSYEFKNTNGLIFLGNGILSNSLYNQKFPKANSNDSVLVFSHYPDKKTLKWRFIDAGN